MMAAGIGGPQYATKSVVAVYGHNQLHVVGCFSAIEKMVFIYGNLTLGNVLAGLKAVKLAGFYLEIHQITF